jgi:hypothetical protein
VTHCVWLTSAWMLTTTCLHVHAGVCVCLSMCLLDCLFYITKMVCIILIWRLSVCLPVCLFIMNDLHSPGLCMRFGHEHWDFPGMFLFLWRRGLGADKEHGCS